MVTTAAPEPRVKHEISVEGTKRIVIRGPHETKLYDDLAYLGVADLAGNGPIITRKTHVSPSSEDAYHTFELARKMDIDFVVVYVGPVGKETEIISGLAGDYLVESREVSRGEITSVGLINISPRNGRAWYEHLENLRFAEIVQREGLWNASMAFATQMRHSE